MEINEEGKGESKGRSKNKWVDEIEYENGW